MSEIIREITAESGCPLRIYELRTDWLAQMVTLREPSPLPFWKAVDRICDALAIFSTTWAPGPTG